MKKPMLLMAPVVLLVALGLTACGTTNTPSTSTSSSQTTSQSSQSQATQTSQPAHQANVAMTIMPGSHLGPDGKLHDSFSPADITVVQGVPTKVTVYNYDDGAHSFTSQDLGLNVQIPGSKKEGQPSVTTFTINATKAGNFTWVCVVPCDGAGNPNKPGSNKGWAMSHDGYMMGTVTVLAQQPADDTFAMTIKDGLQLGPDGKIHDSFSPADLTVTKGVPMQVTVYNYDSGEHSFTSKDLGLNVVFPGAKKTGDPSVTTFTINATNSGDFTWVCDIPCDGAGDKSAGSANGWAMSHDGYMMGTVHVQG